MATSKKSVKSILISGSNPPPSPSPTIADVTTSRSCWICPIHKQKYPLFWIMPPPPLLKNLPVLGFFKTHKLKNPENPKFYKRLKGGRGFQDRAPSISRPMSTFMNSILKISGIRKNLKFKKFRFTRGEFY